jgi:linoleoyl-CoA desaturase
LTKISFPAREGIHDTLKQRVHEVLAQEGAAPTGDLRMMVKTAVILAWLVTAYVLLVFFSTSLVMAIISAYLLAQAFALVGFNVMHDAVHGSYSKSRWVNKVMSYTLDIVGGSQWLWQHKHNILHHTYTNIAAMDDDLETFGMLRLSPEQPRRPWHRFQHLYAFPLYSLLTLSWVTFADFRKFFTRRIGDYRLPKPTASEATLFFLTKMFYFGYMVLLPLFFHPVLHVLLAFVGIHLVLGLMISVVFQLAHTGEGTSFPQPDSSTGRLPREWAVHQIETTADFAPNNRLVSWYLGGLNFQVEHHLFSRISHVHYPKLQPAVERTCRELGIRYTCHPTVLAALVAHYRLLRSLGGPEPEAAGA